LGFLHVPSDPPQAVFVSQPQRSPSSDTGKQKDKTTDRPNVDNRISG
jgi:hypothetical protein